MEKLVYQLKPAEVARISLCHRHGGKQNMNTVVIYYY